MTQAQWIKPKRPYISLKSQLEAADVVIDRLTKERDEAYAILRALAEAERLEDIALASQDAPNARQTWTAWQMQRLQASALLRGWAANHPRD